MGEKKMSEVMNLCRRSKCCPTMERLEEDKYMIKDDFDGEVILTEENIQIMYEGLKKLMEL